MKECAQGYIDIIRFCGVLVIARKRSLGQGNVLHLCVILFTGGRGVCPTPGCRRRPPGVGQTPLDADPTGLGRPPGVGQTPQMQTSPQGWADPSRCRPGGLGRPPRVGQTPLDADPPGLGRPPQGWADPPQGLGRPPWMQTSPPLRSTSGWYASYWNEYLSMKLRKVS